jgi:long-chain acyl-CoA synthetase
VSALERALAGVAAVVHLPPGTSTSARLDTALQEDIDATLAALATARQRGTPFVLVSRLSAMANVQGLRAEVLPSPAPAGTAFDVDADIASCREAVQFARAAASFADHLSRCAEETHARLRALGGAASGTAFDRAFHAAREQSLAQAMERALVERAAGWRYATASPWAVRGYTCALAELLVAREATAAGTPWAIVRVPALFDGQQGGVLTALLEAADAPLPLAFAPGVRLEALPADLAADAIALVVEGLGRSGQSGIVHLTGPISGARLADLLALHRRGARARPWGPGRGALDIARSVVDSARSDGVAGLRAAARTSIGRAKPSPPWMRAPPFFVDDARFSARSLRLFAARAGRPPESARSEVDWRAVLLGPTGSLRALDAERRATAQREQRAPRAAWDSLPHLLNEAASRYGSRPALSLISADDVVDVTYSELRARALAVARRLRAVGVVPGDRVVLSGQNHPAWGVVAFGVACARAVLVPLDPNLEEAQVKNIMAKARPALAVVDVAARARFGWGRGWGRSSHAGLVLDLQLTAAEGSPDEPPTELDLPSSDELASVLFTSGTTGDPKGVMLTHGNFTSLLASLQAIFPVGAGDRMLSVLPLHHTFEFSCGLLMPLASGARIYTPDALTGERVLYALKIGKITALVGVPALWQLFERRITKLALERGDVVHGVVRALLRANRAFGKRTGKSFGRIALKPIHDELGGHLRTLISGGSALPPSVHDMFQGLGLPVAEGYGLTEAAPVLTVAAGLPGAPAGTVGRPIPGITVRIVDADPSTGVGEVWAHGPNVMRGYFEDEVATGVALQDGWLKTGDLGLIDGDGRLRLVGRSKDVVVTSSGENVYLDDAEKRLEDIEGLGELTLLGLPDPRGGERLGCAFVASTNDEAGRERAVKALQQRLLKLPAWSRPAVIEAVDGPLPRTATRKVKRKEVRRILDDIIARKAALSSTASSSTGKDTAPMVAVRAALALVAGVDARTVTSSTRPAQDLGFDSLMWVELQSALEPIAGKLDAEQLVQQETVADLEAFVRAPRGEQVREDGGTASERAVLPKSARVTWSDALLPLAKPLGRAALTFVQREAYRTVFDARVTGRAFIPHNRNAIVIANHTSHLDTGLVKFALGSFGRDLKPLAAKDYFFEGARAKVAFFEHFTNLVPIDRETGSGLAFEQARAVVDGGHVCLIFPEGTRRADGTLGPFKPLVARLSLTTGVDVLPIWMDGNHAALPRGTHVPNLSARRLEAHIGPPLAASDMARLTAHLAPVQQARAATDIIRKAIVALSEERMLQLSVVRSLEELDDGVVVRPEAASA